MQMYAHIRKVRGVTMHIHERFGLGGPESTLVSIDLGPMPNCYMWGSALVGGVAYADVCTLHGGLG